MHKLTKHSNFGTLEEMRGLPLLITLGALGTFPAHAGGARPESLLRKHYTAGRLEDLATQVKFPPGHTWKGTLRDAWVWPSSAAYPLVTSAVQGPPGHTLVHMGGPNATGGSPPHRDEARWEFRPGSTDVLGKAIGVDPSGKVNQLLIHGDRKPGVVLLNENCTQIRTWEVTFTHTGSTSEPDSVFIRCTETPAEKSVTLEVSSPPHTLTWVRGPSFVPQAPGPILRLEKILLSEPTSNTNPSAPQPTAAWSTPQGTFRLYRQWQAPRSFVRIFPLDFSAFGVLGLQTGRGQMITGGVGWIPSLEFKFGLNLNLWMLAEFPLTVELGRPTLANTFAGTVGYQLWRFRLEAGGGLYALYEFETYAPMAVGKLRFDLRPWLSRFVVGPQFSYQLILPGPFTIHQAQLGFDFSFF